MSTPPEDIRTWTTDDILKYGIEEKPTYIMGRWVHSLKPALLGKDLDSLFPNALEQAFERLDVPDDAYLSDEGIVYP